MTLEQQRRAWQVAEAERFDRWQASNLQGPAFANARRYYAEQQEAARTANYRIAWSQDAGGYFAQWRNGEREWITVGPARRGHAEACLDAKLNAGVAGTGCRLHPLIANLTAGRREYDVDLDKPYPGY